MVLIYIVGVSCDKWSFIKAREEFLYPPFEAPLIVIVPCDIDVGNVAVPKWLSILLT